MTAEEEIHLIELELKGVAHDRYTVLDILDRKSQKLRARRSELWKEVDPSRRRSSA